MINQGLFTSTDSNRSTPQWLYDELNILFNFTLDPCADDLNHKCDLYYTKEQDGLSQNWKGHTVFMNPPYGKGIYEWVHKAWVESHKEDTRVIALLPSRTDTKWWNDIVMKASVIRFIEGRLKFGDATNSAPFPSAIVSFLGLTRVFPLVSTYKQGGNIAGLEDDVD